jgi:hypothetical protein
MDVLIPASAPERGEIHIEQRESAFVAWTHGTGASFFLFLLSSKTDSWI